MNEHISAILLMGGEGKRLGHETPKQFHRLSGKKIYLHTLERFLETGLFHEIILVCHAGNIQAVQEEVRGYTACIRTVPGGATRQESSLLGLLASSPATDLVVIHDAVRPFVSEKILQNNVEIARRFGAVDTCIPSADTIVHSQKDAQISSIPTRREYLRGQTPQSFSYKLILEAHKHTERQEASDDCTLVLDKGYPVHITPGDEYNIKITTELDLFLAEQIFRLKRSSIKSSSLGGLQGKRIAITGGTGGIGLAIAALLKSEGAEPLIISRSSAMYPADLSSPSSAAAIFAKIGEVDGLINSVGLFKRKEVEHLSFEEIDALISTNLSSVIYSCKAARITKGGHIINIASSSYARGRKEYAIYSSTKAAIVNFTQGLSEEKPSLCINALVPARTATAMRLTHFPEDDPSSLLEPEEVADAVIALLKQGDTTGSIVEVKKRSLAMTQEV